MSGDGFIFLLVGPSGVGKNTLMDMVVRRMSKITQLPTVTTRKQRPSEVEGREHYFISRDQFEVHISNNDLLEWEEMHGNKYGTLRSTFESTIATDMQRIADVDVRGARNLRSLYPEHVVTMFILPPSLEALRTRILSRGPIEEDELASRLERAVAELEYALECQWCIMNDDKYVAAREVQRLIRVERRRRSRTWQRSTMANFSPRKRNMLG